MKRMTVPAILAAAMLAFSLSGCGQQTQNITEDTLKGIWSLDSDSQLGFEAYIDFEDDQLFEMVLADGWLSGTYAVSNGSATVTFDSLDVEPAELEEETADDASSSASASASEASSASASASEASSSSANASKTAKLTYSNNKLTLGTADGSKLVFVKDDSEKAKEMFSYDMSGMDGFSMDDGTGEDVQYVEEVIENIDPVTVADDDKFTITVTGKGTDYTGDPCYRLSISNKTDKAVYVVPEDTFKVGGKNVEAGLGDELEAGASIETEMYFAQDELGGGLELLTGVEGVIQVLDNSTDDEVAKYTFRMD